MTEWWLDKALAEKDAEIARLNARLAACAEVLRGLFFNGFGEQAERLVLLSSDGRDLGGWSRAAIEQRLAALLATLPKMEETR